MTAEKALTKTEPYAIMDPNENIMEIIQLNMAGESLSISDLDTIKTPTGGSTVWSIPTAGDDEIIKSFEGIIIHSQIQRTYWEEEFTGKGQPPNCFSNDAITGTGKPGGDCATCPNDKFGSAKGGKGKGKACSTKRIMFVLRKNSLLPSVIRVPVGSLKNSRNYLRALSNERQKMYTVYTEFALEKAQSSENIKYAQITFKMVGSLTEVETVAIEAYREKILPYVDQAAAMFVPDDK